MSVYMLLDIYLRLSDLRLEDLNADGDSKGLVHAEKRLRERAAMWGARVGEVIIENDFEDGKPKPASAFKKKTVMMPDGKKKKIVVRPGFRRLLDRIESGQSGGFMTMDLDRAVRDPRDLEDLIDAIQDAKANVRSISGNLTLTDGGSDGELDMARMMVMMANKASRDTARRVKEARRRQAENGEWGGGKRPFGFQDDGVSVNEVEAKVIKDCIRAVLAGSSLRSLNQDLRDRDFPTVKGGPWTPGSLKDILCRPRNAGIIVYAGKELEKRAPWEPIVPEDEFRAVVAKLTVRKAAPGRAARWLGSGIYFCSCGGRVSAHNQQTRAGRYRCKDTGLMGGDHTSRDIEKLDNYVRDLIIDWCAQPVASQRLMPAEEVKVDVDGMRAEVISLRERLKGWARDAFNQKITQDQLEIMTQMTNERIADIEDKLAAVQRVRTAVHDLVDAVTGMSDLNERRAHLLSVWNDSPLSARRQVVKELMTVKLLPARRGKIFDPESLQIIWNL